MFCEVVYKQKRCNNVATKVVLYQAFKRVRACDKCAQLFLEHCGKEDANRKMSCPDSLSLAFELNEASVYDINPASMGCQSINVMRTDDA